MLYYQALDLRLVGDSDADQGGDLDQRKSTSNYVFLHSDDARSWSSNKRSYIVLSTKESKYVLCSALIQECV